MGREGKTIRSCRLFVVIFLAALLSACSGDAIVRGRLDYDLRLPESRRHVDWPKPPDEPRLRYAGELYGEPNFIDMSSVNVSFLTRAAIATGKWLAGLLSVNEKVMLIRPMHGVTDAEGRVYVVDAGRSAILVFKPQAEEGKKGEGELLVWTRAKEYRGFESPIAIAAAWGGSLAVSDAKLKAIFLIDRKGNPIGDIGTGLLERPTGVAFDNARGHLYVADTEACDVKVFDKAGALVRTIGRAGSDPGEFNAPTHLAFAGDALHVSDTLNNRVQVFDPDGRFLRVTGEVGVSVGQFSRPKGVAADAERKLTYVIESYFAHLLIYDEQGRFLLGIDGSGLREGKFMLPAGVWLGGDGKVFVADMYNNRVVVFEKLSDKRD